MQFNESIIIPIIISIVELIKGLGLPKKFSALFAVAIGVIIGIFYLHPLDIKLGIFEGTVYGLTAAGLYSGTKNVFQQFRNNKSV
jgi:L-cystine uptake protein TcyP (sodium:dicarboxylate symporter family)